MQPLTVGIDMPSKQAMTKLAHAAERLNRVSDQLNESLEIFEDQLSTLGIGLVYWYGEGEPNIDDYLIDAEDPGPTLLDERTSVDSRLGWLIGYAKIEGKWRVAVKRVHLIEALVDITGGIVQQRGFVVHRAHAPIALVKAPRSVRIAAAGELEGLVDALTGKLEGYAEDIEAASALMGDKQATAVVAAREADRELEKDVALARDVLSEQLRKR